MRSTSKAHLWDALHACEAIVSFTRGVDEQAFHESLLLRSATERQLEILGEALRRLRQSDAATASCVPELDQIIGMRNILAHEYGVVDHAIVWSVVQTRLHPLSSALSSLLNAE